MFNPESFQVSEDKTHREVIDNIKYQYIECLRVYQNYSLYFKTNNIGYCFIFEKELSKNGTQCYQNLLLMQDPKNRQKKQLRFGMWACNGRFDRFDERIIFLF